MFPETHPAQDDADRMSNNIHLYCTQAADAIEHMQKTILRLENELGVYDDLPMVDQSMVLSKKEKTTEPPKDELANNSPKVGREFGEWIPVTKWLPECDLGAEVGNIEWISCGMVHAGCFGRGGKYRDAYFRTWTDAGEGIDAKDADYWRAVTLQKPPKEETS
jgi:hypothetical protein